MVCFLVSSVPKPTRSEDVLPSPSKLGLKRGRNSAVPLSPAAGLATSRRGLGDKDQLMPLSSLATRRDPHFSQQKSVEGRGEMVAKDVCLLQKICEAKPLRRRRRNVLRRALSC